MNEEFQENPHLHNFYAHMQKEIEGHNPYAYPVQQFFMEEWFKKELIEKYVNNYLIQDRMFLEYFEIFVKNLFDSGLMLNENFVQLQESYRQLLQQIKLPKYVFFLKGSIENIVQRITRRNREGEAKEISVEYLQTLQNKYDNFLSLLQTIYHKEQLIIIDTDNKDAQEVLEEALKRFWEVHPEQQEYKQNIMRLFNYEKLITYISKSNSIFSNLSLERFLFRDNQITHPLLLFYQNDKSVIIGRNQNPWKECQIDQMNKDGVTLCWRYSGGGAVYQDLGNLCFSFLTPIDIDILPLDMKLHHNKILQNAFQKIGLQVESQGRNDLLLNGKKFSGSAFEVEMGGITNKKKVMHHGTILFNTNLDVIPKYLTPNILKIQSKGIDSVWQRVTNIQQIDPTIKLDTIVQSIIDSFQEYFQSKKNNQIEEISQQEIQEQQKIQNYQQQLQSQEWLFGETPQFTNSFEHWFTWGLVEINLQVDRGIVKYIKIYSDVLFPDIVEEIQKYFNKGTLKYNFEEFSDAFRNIKQYFIGSSEKIQILKEFFDVFSEKIKTQN